MASGDENIGRHICIFFFASKYVAAGLSLPGVALVAQGILLKLIR